MRPVSGDSRPPAQGAAPYALYHFGTSGTAVAVATAVTHPLDVIKVRLQMQLAGQRGNLVGMVVLTEGVKSLYKGGSATLARLGPQTAITFVVCEKLRELVGMAAI